MAYRTDECIVMVTGGSGFLGQHVVKLLNTHADHVTAIRVVDLVPFVNKLDYRPTKPVKSYVGSITDARLMRSAMRGCQSVIHLAAVTDTSMFPNTARLKEVHVKGTMTTLLAAMGTFGVQRLIGCSTWGIALGCDQNLINGDEETPLPERQIHAEYTLTKHASEQLVLEANCDRFLTACIRPVLMYGELDDTYMPTIFRNVKAAGGTLYRINCGNTIHQQAYVGNIAWSFICAERCLWQECKCIGFTRENSFAENPQMSGGDGPMDGSKESQNNTKKIAGQVFYAADDTPHQNMVEFQRPFLEACGYRMSKMKIPYHLVLFIAYVVYFTLFLLSFFGVRKNISISLGALRHINLTTFIKYDKAKRLIGYSPLYSVEESYERTKQFCKELAKNS